MHRPEQRGQDTMMVPCKGGTMQWRLNIIVELLEAAWELCPTWNNFIKVEGIHQVIDYRLPLGKKEILTRHRAKLLDKCGRWKNPPHFWHWTGRLAISFFTISQLFFFSAGNLAVASAWSKNLYMPGRCSSKYFIKLKASSRSSCFEGLPAFNLFFGGDATSSGSRATKAPCEAASVCSVLASSATRSMPNWTSKDWHTWQLMSPNPATPSRNSNQWPGFSLTCLPLCQAWKWALKSRPRARSVALAAFCLLRTSFFFSGDCAMPSAMSFAIDWFSSISGSAGAAGGFLLERPGDCFMVFEGFNTLEGVVSGSMRFRLGGVAICSWGSGCVSGGAPVSRGLACRACDMAHCSEGSGCVSGGSPVSRSLGCHARDMANGSEGSGSQRAPQSLPKSLSMPAAPNLQSVFTAASSTTHSGISRVLSPKAGDVADREDATWQGHGVMFQNYFEGSLAQPTLPPKKFRGFHLWPRVKFHTVALAGVNSQNYVGQIVAKATNNGKNTASLASKLVSKGLRLPNCKKVSDGFMLAFNT